MQRVYWFGATDYGGGTVNNFLTDVSAHAQIMHSDKSTPEHNSWHTCTCTHAHAHAHDMRT